MSVTESQAVSNYNEAFTLLKENPPEQRLDIQLPYEKFRQLDNAFSELKSEADISEDRMYPSLTYNSLTQTVTVVTAPSGIHEGAARWIDSEIIKFVGNYLSTRSPHTFKSIGQVGSTTKHFPSGYRRSRNEPDADSFIEAYGKLLDDKDMWINGMGVKVIILVCFNETPWFKYPGTAPFQDIADRGAEKAAMSRTVGESTRLNIQRGDYGPLGYRGHEWVGELTEAFIEVSRQDSHDRFDLIQDGFPVARDNLPADISVIRVSVPIPNYSKVKHKRKTLIVK